jgi:arylsulfatase A-like enzyme
MRADSQPSPRVGGPLADADAPSAADDDASDRPRHAAHRRRTGWRSVVVAALGVVGLAGLAITQPLLDLFGRNPEFFVAGRYDAGQIVGFALVVACAPALVALLIVGALWLVAPRAGQVAYALAIWAFAALFGLALLDTAGVERIALALGAAAALGALVTWLAMSRPAARTFLAYLAAGNVAFVVVFLVGSPAGELVTTPAQAVDRGSVSAPPLPGPVILVILDEFPVSTVMREDGTLNRERFPSLGRLADSSTWFRNASSHSPMTAQSVPSLLTGTLHEDGTLPTYQDHPRSYLTLFGARYPVNRYELLTDMCPPSYCDPPPQSALADALDDARVVYGHRVLPGSLADGLPSVDHSWGDFGSDDGGAGPASESGAGEVTGTTTTTTIDDAYDRWREMPAVDRGALGQSRAVDEVTSRIGPEASVNLVHVALPHYPWTLTPWGDRLYKLPRFQQEPDDPSYDFAAMQRRQLHGMQAGAADAAVGRMIDHLQSVGAWDDATIVVTSDHGLGLTPPDVGRALTDDNAEELLRIPLFVKAPGQATGDVDDAPAQTIDVLPTIIDAVGATTNWELDGHSLLDGSRPTVDPHVGPTVRPALQVAARHRADTPYGDGWLGLAAIGDQGDLVGRTVSDLPVGQPSDLSWQLGAADVLDDLPTDDGRVPQWITGTVATPDGARPPELVIALNGRLAGVAGGYSESDDGGWRFAGFIGVPFRTGSNEVVGYEVERTALGPVLHEVAAP